MVFIPGGNYLRVSLCTRVHHSNSSPLCESVAGELPSSESPPHPPQGYSGGVIYDGQYVSNSSNTVVVTINYRLGAIGFLVYGSPTEDNAISGNFGIKVYTIASICTTHCMYCGYICI